MISSVELTAEKNVGSDAVLIASADGSFHIEKDTQKVFEFQVKPFHLYRLEFESLNATTGYWVADFYDASGEFNYADNYSGIDPNSDWTPWTTVFMARSEAATSTIGFRPTSTPLDVRNVKLYEVPKSEVLDWMDSFSYSEQVKPFALSENRFEYLPKTIQRLREGKPLRIVALGDSLSNDVQNSLWHLLAERNHPGSVIELIHANGIEKFCTNYQKPEVLERLVIKHKPDLLTIGGVSHRGDSQAIANIVRTVREKVPEVECLFFDASANPYYEIELRQKFFAELEPLSRAERFALLDLSALYEEQVKHIGKSAEYYKRDNAHANDRGKQLMGHLYSLFFI
jgi:hypothetical protein